jgi:hypothetical protein
LVCARETDVGKDIVFTETDIGNVIKSKAAVYAAGKILLESVGMSEHSVDRIFAAGGFGNYLRIQSAITIGLLPDIPVEKIKFIGNSSLSGAHKALLSKHALEEATQIAKKMTYFELSTNPTFMDEFIAAMFIPHTNLDLFPNVSRNARERELSPSSIVTESNTAPFQSTKEKPTEKLKKEKAMEGLKELNQELGALKAELDDRKAALPMHDATPQQWIVIEELEDKIAETKRALKSLNKNNNK